MVVSSSVYISHYNINLSRYFIADDIYSGSPHNMYEEPKLKVIVQEQVMAKKISHFFRTHANVVC